MMKKYAPYYFDEKNEYYIYTRIGERYREAFLGKEKKSYDSFEFKNYIEWKTYFIKKFINSDNNDINFQRFLNRRMRRFMRNLDLVRSVAVPIYVGEFSCLISIFQSNKIQLSITMLLVAIVINVIVIFYLIHVYSSKVSFYEDCIDIVINENTNHQK